jgi:uncharacterized protein YifE (UPF0438 family)
MVNFTEEKTFTLSEEKLLDNHQVTTHLLKSGAEVKEQKKKNKVNRYVTGERKEAGFSGRLSWQILYIHMRVRLELNHGEIEQEKTTVSPHLL